MTRFEKRDPRSIAGNGCIGFVDKLYWRPALGVVLGSWHCYRKIIVDGKNRFESLCGRHHLKNGRTDGQSCRRPPPMMRCARCDVMEMDRRGWEESGPESPNWEDAYPSEPHEVGR